MALFSEPSPRWGHFLAAVEHEIYLWGGVTKDFSKEKDILACSVHRFSPVQEIWRELHCAGPYPPGLYNGACAAVDHHLYVYGGSNINRQSSLFQLDVRQSIWQEISSTGPMRKTGCGMVPYHGGSRLALFGGYGIPLGPTQQGAQFIEGSWKEGHTNEMHIFDLKQGMWSSSLASGTRPPPCSHFSFTTVSDNQAVLFGGNQPSKRTNEAYFLNLARMHWSKLELSAGEPCPMGRSHHAAVCLNYGESHPHLLVTGGLGDNYKALSDVWLMDVHSRKWMQVDCPNHQARRSHSAAVFELTPTLKEVVIVGGEAYSGILSNTTVLQFESQPIADATSERKWSLTGTGVGTQLGGEERVRAKIQVVCTAVAEGAKRENESSARVEVVEQRASVAEGSVREGECRAREQEGQKQELRVEKEAAENRAREMEGEKLAAEEAVRKTEREKDTAKAESEEARSKAREAERKFTEANKRVGEVETRLREVETRLREAECAVQEAETRAREAQSRALKEETKAKIAEGRVNRLENQWVVEGEEIQMTDQEVGRGGWATVYVAKFRGVRVAAKCVHNQIISPHNKQLFKREMDMAARIRHPNLLQFIGATLEGKMVILTELMPTSLRRELEIECEMTPKLTISTGLDVARALNYLHKFRPHPLVHRDISSANVLLEPLPNGRWRAKVSDFGSVNLQQQLQTVNPGNPSYSAPEAGDPSQQSPKMDIFSFGILLMEMLTGVFPEMDQREELLDRVHHRQLRSLICSCLKRRKEDRPNASDIIAQLT